MTKKTKLNPWSASGWDVTKQMEITAADVQLAARLAKAAGCELGATKPNTDKS